MWLKVTYLPWWGRAEGTKGSVTLPYTYAFFIPPSTYTETHSHVYPIISLNDGASLKSV
jgi:hypothetical protein